MPSKDDEFNRSYDEAKYRCVEWLDRDPLEGIPPALLNSSHIYDYAEKVGLIFPFRREALKSSSYALRLGRFCQWWDESGDKVEKILGKDERLRVRRNSIVYVTTDETFLLPHYLAVRFNLHITLVHCGFLLGTGPLVDPGFCGQLLIPLHNLTNNDYEIKRGEEIIWVEFTKTSPIHGQAGGALANFQRFPDRKKNLEPHHYFGKALERVKRSSKAGILSSLGGVESDIKEFSRKTKEDVDEIKNWGLLALLALLFTVASILMSGYILVNGVKSDLSDSSRSIGELLRSVAVQPSQQEYNRLVLRVELLERELEQVKAKKEERQADP